MKKITPEPIQQIAEIKSDSNADTRRINELLALGDIHTASGFPLESRIQIDLYLVDRISDYFNNQCLMNNTKPMKIHKDIEAAKLACENYLKQLDELQEKYGISEECEDSCCPVYVIAKYYDKDGNVKTHYS